MYEYFRDIEKIPESPDVAQLIKSAKDQTKAIIDAALGIRANCAA